MTAGTPAWRWERASDAPVVHELLCASDAHHAAATGTAAPVRRPGTTAGLVAARSVWLLLRDDHPVGMFTLTDTPPEDVDRACFPPAARPRYLRRLVVAPGEIVAGSLVGVSCLRMALQVAAEQGADAVRAEAHPDLTGSVELLTRHRFVRCGQVHGDDTGRRWIHLQRSL
ncbi:hypothetical protein [Longispora urticae]